MFGQLSRAQRLQQLRQQAQQQQPQAAHPTRTTRSPGTNNGQGLLTTTNSLGDMVNTINRLSLGMNKLKSNKMQGFGVLPAHGMSRDPFQDMLVRRGPSGT